MAYLTIDVTAQNSIVAPPAQRNAALRKAFSFIGESWHNRFKMEKFKDSATRKYGLSPRSGEPGSGRAFKGSYTQRKLRRGSNGQTNAIGETKPFVWSGLSRNNARASRKVVAKAVRGYGSADCIINAPTLNLRPKGGRINLREEFERVTEEERRTLEKDGLFIYGAELARAVKSAGKTRFSS